MKFVPKIGDEFPLSEGQIEELTRSVIAVVFIVLASIAVLVATVASFIKGEFSLVFTLWSVIGPLVGFVFSYYFRGHGPGGGKSDDPSAARIA